MNLRIVLSLSLTSLAIAGCSTPPTPAAAPVATAKPVEVASTAKQAPAATNSAQPQAVALNPLDDPKSPLANRAVYFDFDSSVVKSDYQPLLDAHGKFLSHTLTAKVRLEGHTDERGSSEYNLALGQRRAESVLQSMKLLGVNVSQMEPTSFGKEKSTASGHDEASWAKDRRVDLDYVHR